MTKRSAEDGRRARRPQCDARCHPPGLTYLGSESIYDVELENGRRVRTLRSNLTRWEAEDFHLGRAGLAVLARRAPPAVLLS